VRGDREVTGSGVCKGVGEAPTFTEWFMMMVPTYPEDDSRALKVYQLLALVQPTPSTSQVK